MCAAPFEFKSGDVSHSSCNFRNARLSGVVGKMLPCDDAGPGSFLAEKNFIIFLNNVFSFHRVYLLGSFINFNINVENLYPAPVGWYDIGN